MPDLPATLRRRSRPRWRATGALALAAAMLVTASSACGSGGGGSDSSAGTSGTASTTPVAPRDAMGPTASPATTAAPPSTAPPATDGPGAGLTIVVDPGHNGANGAHPEEINRPVDAGGFTKACNTTGTATNDGVTESSINMQVGLLLRDRLQAAGAEVILTRQDDEGVGPCIDVRARTAADAGADALISLHADGAGAGQTGFHVIHPALRPGYTDDTVEPSARMAAAVRDSLVAGGFSPATYVGEDGLNQRDDLGTLNLARVPAVMVEAGNLRDAGDAAVLVDPAGQARLADALAAGVLAFAGA
jgi:N-acetylmuramoyl-L-alanine amidase